MHIPVARPGRKRHDGAVLPWLQQRKFALLQPGEDGAVVAFPAWPCHWDVHFRLYAPWNTTVEGVWQGGAVVNLTVVPESRAAAVIFATGC